MSDITDDGVPAGSRFSALGLTGLLLGGLAMPERKVAQGLRRCMCYVFNSLAGAEGWSVTNVAALLIATTLEANVAMRAIVRRDTGESYEKFLRGLAKASGMATPKREQLARMDRKRKKRVSNEEWKSPSDGDARIAKMKVGIGCAEAESRCPVRKT